MKRTGKLLPALLIVGILAGCAQQPVPGSVPAVESKAVSSEASAPSLPASSSEVSEPASSESVVSSEAEETSSSASSVPASSEATSSETLPPVESEEIPELVCPLASSQAEAPASSQTQPPASSETVSSAPPASSAADDVPEDKRPMTEAEVDQAIQEAIAYAESKGFYLWDDSMSINYNGYYNPANSTFGKSKFAESLHYHIDQLYKIAQEDAYWEEGMTISYKIVKGPIEGEPNAWFGYVLY